MIMIVISFFSSIEKTGEICHKPAVSITYFTALSQIPVLSVTGI